MLRLLFSLLKKDVQIFVSDKRAMIITFAVPIGIASFLGSLMANIASPKLDQLPVLIVDQDQSAISKGIFDRLSHLKALKPELVSLADAAAKTKSGDVSTAIVLPKGFGAQASASMTGGPRPDLTIYQDPSKGLETQVVKGYLTQVATQVIAQQTFGNTAATSGTPFNLRDQQQASPDAQAWSGSAHSFAGMGVQAMFFGAVEAAMGMMRDRRNGIWSRLRASPVSPWLILLGRFCGGAILSFLVYVVVFSVGMLLFSYRITGSLAGFFLVAFCIGAMAASVGLFIAALGKNEQQSRPLSILIILVMLMLGGAWIPTFLLPDWVQKVSLFTPVRWAVDGIDTMTWRGGTFQQSLPFAGVLLLFALVLSLIAGKRFRWEPESR
jgi:ABC-2 type transport system permease protein